jgi:hypothetical protein
MCDYSLHSVQSRPAKVGDEAFAWPRSLADRDCHISNIFKNYDPLKLDSV